MAWDNLEQGLHIYVTYDDSRLGSHWFYEVKAGAFWEDTYSTNHEPLCAFNFSTDVSENARVLLGGRDGYLRGYDDLNDTDGTVPIASHVVYGPIRLTQDDIGDGLLMEMVATMAQQSGGITWTVYRGDTNEAVNYATAFATGTWAYDQTRQSALQYSSWVRARGGSVSIKLSNADNRRWVMEKLMGTIQRGGKLVMR